MDNTQRVIFDNNPHVHLRDIFDTAFQAELHQADDLVPLNEPRKIYAKIFSNCYNLNESFKDGDSPEPERVGRYYEPDVEIMRRNQLGFRDYNHNNSVS